MRTFITVLNEFEGIHKYENAPDEVSFLRNDHRHLFKIRSKIEVFHEDRELEFIMVKHLIQGRINLELDEHDNIWYMNNLSCEQVALIVYNLLKQRYGSDRYISVEVSEDGENSAIIEGEKNENN